MSGRIPGYGGTILHVDLKAGEVSKRPLDPSFARLLVGGIGFSTKILYDDVGPATDPFGPGNELIFAVGPLTGTDAPYSGRFEITTRSPLTDTIGSGNSGGIWGVKLKHAGYDALVVRGISEGPVYLWIDDEMVEIRRADYLWGVDVLETTEALKRELGGRRPDDVSVLAIGPAGENLVRYACPINDRYHAAGRAGAGGVMGSKRLKAIAIRGTRRVEVADPEGFRNAIRAAIGRVVESPLHKTFRLYASLGVGKRYEEIGCLPGRNFQTGHVPGFYERMGVEAIKPYITGTEGSCYRCPIACFHMVEVREGRHAGLRLSSGTFVSILTEFGAKVGIDDPAATWRCKEACHRLGMDYCSASGSISFAVELYQRGLIGQAETDGLRLDWGDEDAMVEMLSRIAYRKGIGDTLAEGSVRAAEIIGKGSSRYAMAVKGLELPWTDPRSATRGWSLGYIIDPRGDNVKTTHTTMGDAIDAAWGPERYDMPDDVREAIFGSEPEVDPTSFGKKAAMARWVTDLSQMAGTLCSCLFTVTRGVLGPTYYSNLLSACTGWEVKPEELMLVGERVTNLRRAYAARDGFTRKEDRWPDKFYEEPLPEGPSRGAILSKEEVEKALEEYYRLRGWSPETGNPTREKLVELGLSDVADDLERAGKI